MEALFHSEQGHVAAFAGEGLSKRRLARKRLIVNVDSGSVHSAQLYLFGSCYDATSQPMSVLFNGTEVGPLQPDPIQQLHWFSLSVPTDLVRRGENWITLGSDSPSLSSWTIGIEGGLPSADSEVSFDAGETWRRTGMSLSSALTGEYVIRLRVSGDFTVDNNPPLFSWEDGQSPLLRDLRNLIPLHVQTIRDVLEQATALKTWIAGLWDFRNSSEGAIYTPWDPWTILEWCGKNRGYGGSKPVCMCVHYAVFFAQCCLALGIPARNVVTAEHLGKGTGHFMAEIWLSEEDKWVLIDPQGDLVFRDGSNYLSMREVYEKGSAIGDCIVEGPATARHRAKLGDAWFDESLGKGNSFRLWGVWYRNDYLTRPDCCPPGHGQVGYCETDIHWYEPCCRTEDLGMFPYVLDPSEYCVGPPDGFQGIRKTFSE